MPVASGTVRVKICGITDPASLEAARPADWIGLVFHPASPRAMTARRARALLAGAPGHPPAIGLFVAPDAAVIAQVLDEVPLDGLQLYTDARTASALRRRFGLPVWRAVGIAQAADLPDRADGIDALVIESRPPPGAALPGGNAAGFDHRLTRNWAAPLPWLLAGGLDAGNVAQAIRDSGAAAVDVSSGVEHRRGLKDPELIAAFLAAVASV